MTQHNFENDNKYHERSVQARESTLVSVVVNIFLSALQVVVGIFSGSQGLIADGMHSFSDLVADGVVLMANKKSRRPSDHDHHYGHWRYENGASLIIGAMLLLVGGGMLWSAAGHLAQPQTIPPVHSAALWMALVALAVYFAMSGSTTNPADEMVKVPDFTSQSNISESGVKKALEDLGLKLVSKQDTTSSEAEGTVTKQDPEGGKQVAKARR